MSYIGCLGGSIIIIIIIIVVIVIIIIVDLQNARLMTATRRTRKTPVAPTTIARLTWS